MLVGGVPRFSLEGIFSHCMLFSARTKVYLRFFLAKRKLINLFSRQLLAYSGALFVLFIVGVLLSDRFMALTLPLRLILLIVLVGIHLDSMGMMLSKHLDIAHRNYLKSLGFEKMDIRQQSCIVSLPANFAQALLLSVLVFWKWGFVATLGLGVAFFFLAEGFSFVFLPLRDKAMRRLVVTGNTRKKKQGRQKAFKTPYRAFLFKDMRMLGVSGIIGFFSIFVMGIFMILTSRIGDSWQFYLFCLYISVLMISFYVGGLVYANETEAFHLYYRPILHLTEKMMLLYKFPLQAVLIVASIVVLVAFDAALHGVEARYIFLAAGLGVYFMLFALSMDVVYIYRIKTRKEFDSLYQLSLIPVTIIPGVPLVCACMSLAKIRKLNRTGTKVQKVKKYPC